MSNVEVDRSEASQHARTGAAPGVYRAMPGAHATTASSPVDATPNTSTARERPTSSTSPDLAAAAEARRRFYELRSLRRELSGRLAVPEASGATAPSTPLSSMHTLTFPVPASFGLPLDRLPAEDAATRYLLRTAAAERALRLQQDENDELKRLVITQRGEAEGLRQQLERLSAELAASQQALLRQTATMRSLTSEMERRDAYRLIKDHRANTVEGQAARMAALEAEVAQLKRDKTALETQQQQQQKEQEEQLRRQKEWRNGCSSAVEVIERDEDELAAEREGANSASCGSHHSKWIPSAEEELQQLVEILGRMLRSATWNTHVSTADVVFEVTLSDLSFAAAAVAGPVIHVGRQSGGQCQASSTTQSRHSVLVISGPYNPERLLLRAEVDAASHKLPIPSKHRRSLSKDHRQGCFYALPDTQGALSVCVFDHPAEVETPSTPIATATVPVCSLISADAAFGSERAGLRDTAGATSTVHTIHLQKDGEAASFGAAMFVVSVAALSFNAVFSGPYRRGSVDRLLGGGDSNVGEQKSVEELNDDEREGLRRSPTVEPTAVTALSSHVRQQAASLVSPSREDSEAGPSTTEEAEHQPDSPPLLLPASPLSKSNPAP